MLKTSLPGTEFYASPTSKEAIQTALYIVLEALSPASKVFYF